MIWPWRHREERASIVAYQMLENATEELTDLLAQVRKTMAKEDRNE